MKKLTYRFLVSSILLILFLTTLPTQVYSDWTSRTVVNAGQLHSVFFLNAQTGFVGGLSFNNGMYLTRTTNAGNNWTDIYNYSGTGSGTVKSIYFINSNTGWFGGSNFVYVTTNGGFNWTNSNIPFVTDATIGSFSFPDPNLGVGWFARTHGSQGKIGYSVNWGFDWIHQTTTPNPVYSVYFLDLNTGFVAGESGLYMKTTNGGINWSVENLDTEGNSSIIFVSASLGYITATDGVFRKTTNGGTTWSSSTVSGLDLGRLSFPTAATGYITTRGYNIIKTSNSGANWRIMNLPGSFSVNMNDIHFVSAFTGFAVGYGSSPSRYVFLRTTDGGEDPPAVPNNLTATAISSSQINLSWNDLSNNEDGFIIGRSPDGISNWSLIDSVGIGITTYQNTGLCGSTPYYYRVQAYNVAGYSSYSNVAFAVTQPGAPAVPSHVSPANGAQLSTLTPTIDWNDVTCATTYGVQVSTDVNFATTVVNQTGLTASQYVIPGGILQNNVTYYWRTNSTRSAQTSSWSSPWNFATQLLPPAAPTLVSPANNATGVSLTPTLDWNDVSGATSYGVQVSTDVNFATTVVSQTGLPASQYSVPSGILQTNTLYYWRASATGAGGTGAWSTVWGFTTVVSPPPAPVLVSPSNGSTGQSLNPLLDWNDVSGAITYAVQVSTSSGFSTTVVNQTGLAASQYQIPSGLLINNTLYYWRASATNPGGTGAWSTVWNFRTLFLGMSIYSSEIPKEFKLHNNYPNPFNPVTKIRFDIPKESESKIVIYDLLGKEAATLVNEKLAPGAYEIEWNASNYPSGVYLYKFDTDSYSEIKKMVLIK